MKMWDKIALPPIFKMYHLWSILPYYGYLHKWKILMNTINKETNEIWEENEKKLIYFGRNFKIERVIRLNEDLRKAQRNIIDLFLIAIFRTYFSHCETQKSLLYLISLINEDEVIVCDVHQKFNKTIPINFINEENILELLPSILCPSFKQVKINYKNVEPKILWTY